MIGDDHRPPGASLALLKLLKTQPDGGGVNTDTMMVLQIPSQRLEREHHLLSPRFLANIPGFGMNKLNAA
jgi:hypothetical protein